jgi:hypothetical protein
MVHGRDHEHGGADPHRIHYESVGTSGGGGGQGVYTLDSGTSLGGGAHVFQWTFLAGDALLDLTDTYYVHPLAAGVYAYNFGFNFAPLHSYAVSVGNYAVYGFVATGSSGQSAGWQEVRYQAVTSVYEFLGGSGSVVVGQDPDADDGATTYATVANHISGTESGDKYTGGVFVQKVS